MGLAAGGLQSGGGTASSLGAGATGSDLTLSSTDTALQFISTQVNGSDAYKANTNGARWHIGAGTNDWFASDGTTVRLGAAGNGTFEAGIINGNGGAAGVLVTASAVQVSSGKAIYFNGATQSKYIFWDNTNLYMGAGVQLETSLSFLSFTDDSANTGNRTVNSVRGISAFGAGATTITITNSFVIATSTVTAVLQTNDATAILKNVVPGVGSFAITVSAATTGITKVSWVVLN